MTLKDKFKAFIVKAGKKVITHLNKETPIYQPKNQADLNQRISNLAKIKQMTQDYLKKNPKFKVPKEFQSFLK